MVLVGDAELLQVGEGSGAEPAFREVAGAEAGEGESAGGARVLGDYFGDGGGGHGGAPEVLGAGVDLEVEGR
jgi:hypothetical protein